MNVNFNIIEFSFLIVEYKIEFYISSKSCSFAEQFVD